MKKSVLFLLMVLGGLLADFSVLGQGPTIATPANNTNLDPYVPFNVSGTTNRANVRRVRINIEDLADLGNILYTNTVNFATGTTASQGYSFNNIDLSSIWYDGGNFRITISTSLTTNAAYTANTVITVNTVAPAQTNPLIVSPTNGSTYALCQNLTITVNGNYTGARRLSYIVYPTATPGSPLVDSNTDGTDVTFANSTAARTNYNLPAIPLASLSPNTSYTIEVSTFDPSDTQIGSTTTSTFTTGPTINNTPVISSPANNATNVSVNPTINVAAYTGCGTLTTATIIVDKGSVASPADWTGSDSQTISYSSNNGPFSWTPTTALDFGTSYQIRVQFTNGSGTYTSSITTFTTVSVTATITAPTTGATNLSVCGFNVTVAAVSPTPTNGKAYRLQLRYKLASAGSYSGAQTSYTPVDGSTSNFGPYTVTIPASGSLAASTAYDVEARYQVDLVGDGSWTNYGNANTIQVTTGAATSTTPVITFPVDGSTGVTTTPTITVNAYAGCGDLTSAIIELDTETGFTVPNYQVQVYNNNDGPFSWAPTELEYGTLYYVRVRFLQGATTVGTKLISFTTAASDNTQPVLNSPADNSTLDLCSNVILNVNANNPTARSLQVKLYLNGGDPNSPIFNQTYTLANSTAATTAFNVTVPRASFANNVQYLVELTDRSAGNNLISYNYFTLLTGADRSGAIPNTPVITSPADGATVNSFTPTIRIQSPFAGCTLNSVTYTILSGTSGSTVVATQTFNSPTYSWTVPTFLTAGATYRARVTYNTQDGTYSDTNVFTVAPSPGIEIEDPESLTNLDPCGFTVTVARYPSASTIQVEYKKASDASYSAPFYSTDLGTAYSFTFNNTQLQANQSYNMRLTAGTGTGGSFVANSASATVFNFTTTGVGGTLTPTLTVPANGATGVSLTPSITFGTYGGSCGAITNYSIEIVPVGGSGDWSSRPGYYYANSATAPIVIPSGTLTYGTTYKIRVTTEVSLNGGVVGYYSNYDGADSAPGIYTFTTVNPSETYLQLVTSTSNVVGGETYLNSLNQTLQVLAVSGATQYEIQLSTDSTFVSNIHYTATSASNVFAFNPNSQQLISGGKYYIRVRISAPSVGPWTTAANIKHVYNSLHPTTIYTPTGNLSANSTKLQGFHMQNATSMFFQIATDAAFTNLVDVSGPYSPISSDPAGTGIAYERYYYRKWVGSSLVTIPTETVNDNFQAYSTYGVYDYVRYLTPGKTYYVRVKNVRTNSSGTYLQTGYWGATTTFTVASFTRTNTISMVGSLTNMSVKPTIYFATSPANIFNVTSYQMQIATDAAFSNVVVDRIPATLPIVDLTPALNYNTTYYIRVRSQASNDPVGPTNWSAWSATTTFKTTTAPAGRVAAATTSLSGDEESQSVAYPNPFNSTVSVTLKAQYAAVTVSLVDQTGKVVDQTQATGGNTVVLGKRSSQGLYLIRIADQTGVKETIKVVKQY
ncbi:T9SS type A sorting domain-containing protein [Cytophagaceae bacterium YF14B1]|uniref:T9SS type A sorting domain-containing protein n=1 Tax=Xanthocytophaga flava TaxID=3048013 RepID=A0AAE3QR45_9BACT|nr:T9SS type A sorting domain-containing protein [Xanthocytophaga flavus]MDJ1481660.1 T9SS type A sorting domain-containing protein [Xanthocytophaga flavus]